MFLKITSLLKTSLWTYTLSNLHETFTDLDHTLGSKSVKVSWRLLNVYVHSDAFSREVIFKNLGFFWTPFRSILDQPSKGRRQKIKWGPPKSEVRAAKNSSEGRGKLKQGPQKSQVRVWLYFSDLFLKFLAAGAELEQMTNTIQISSTNSFI